MRCVFLKIVNIFSKFLYFWNIYCLLFCVNIADFNGKDTIC
ncbi:hypothetical protein HCCG_01228 [Helicobacter cinaedi CCUG 18818 = ATCC BAA-847]|uniref:Uncharacterized protein n=1 Tax=Helicobacter cinaedi CCUG 18818 = ATCC BAA-847 TaxID=537971 RepID=A0ABN0BAY0_9HELI|nr:hypothetical protein HCCG_01228 [Helicobacter cinaedi CCUG 18818 = ATCC BAA-847]BBB19963.1 hypothetical protein HC081234_11400 [Helicobacter cinaedi]